MTSAKQPGSVKTQRLTTHEDNHNKKQLAIRIVIGVFVIIFTVICMLRVPYFGEFFDGVIFDLLLFGTAKYFFYLTLIGIGILLIWWNKRYWRIVITKRFILFVVISLYALSLIFAIVNYFQKWVNITGTNLTLYLSNYFTEWKAVTWVTGAFVWTSGVIVNGGLWWTLVAAINAGVPAVLLFVILAILLIIITLSIGFKLRWKKLQWLRRKVIVWLGGFYKHPNEIQAKSTIQTVFDKDHTIETAPSPTPTPPRTEYIQAPVSDRPKDQAPRIVPFSLKEDFKSNLAYNEPLVDVSENNMEKNNNFAKVAMANLSEFFVLRSLMAMPQKMECGPSMISIWYEFKNPETVNQLVHYKNEIQTTIKVSKFDVYLKKNILEVQFPVPYPNKVSFKDINNKISHSLNLNCVIGWNAQGQDWTINLSNQATVLLTGALGSGKGMLLSSMLLSLTINHSPAQLLLAIIDTRSSHLSKFENIGHLVERIANTVSDAFLIFEQVLVELKFRVNVLKKAEVSSIDDYNHLPSTVKAIQPLVLVINDIQDLLDADSEYFIRFLTTVHTYAKRLSLSVILGANEITPTLVHDDVKQNFDLIFAFKCENVEESKLLIKKNYLTKLYGRGDFVAIDFANDDFTLNRGLASYVDNNELNKILTTLRSDNNDHS